MFDDLLQAIGVVAIGLILFLGGAMWVISCDNIVLVTKNDNGSLNCKYNNQLYRLEKIELIEKSVN